MTLGGEDTLLIGAGHRKPVAFKVLTIARISEEKARDIAAKVSAKANRSPYPLVATTSLSESSREIFDRASISWLEKDTRQLHLAAPGLYVDVVRLEPVRISVRERPVGADKRASRLGGKSGVLAETLLIHYRSRPIKVTQAAEEAGVSKGLASRLLQRLERQKIVRSEGTGPAKVRFLTDAAALLDLWAREENPAPDQVSKAYLWARSADDVYRKLAGLENPPWRWALGGVAAADLYAQALSRLPDPTLWVAAEVSPIEVIEWLTAESADTGANIEIWQSEGDAALYHAGSRTATYVSPTARDAERNLRTVSRFRAYVECHGSSGRAPEVAAKLRKELKLEAPREQRNR